MSGVDEYPELAWRCPWAYQVGYLDERAATGLLTPGGRSQGGKHAAFYLESRAQGALRQEVGRRENGPLANRALSCWNCWCYGGRVSEPAQGLRVCDLSVHAPAIGPVAAFQSLRRGFVSATRSALADVPRRRRFRACAGASCLRLNRRRDRPGCPGGFRACAGASCLRPPSAPMGHDSRHHVSEPAQGLRVCDEQGAQLFDLGLFVSEPAQGLRVCDSVCSRRCTSATAFQSLRRGFVSATQPTAQGLRVCDEQGAQLFSTSAFLFQSLRRGFVSATNSSKGARNVPWEFQSLRRGFVSATRRLSKPTKRLHLFDPRANPLAHRFWFQYSYRTNGAEWLRRGNERTVCVLGRPSLQRVVHLRTTTQSTRL